MKNSKKLLSGVLALSIIAVIPMSSAFAYQGDPALEGPDCTPERHAEMEAAFAATDYAAWTDIMDGKGRITQMVTADNFSLFVEAHNLAESGDLEGARAIRSELGLGLQNGDGEKTGEGQGYGFSSGDGEFKGQGQGQGQGRNM